jgi:hypothetical protein
MAKLAALEIVNKCLYKNSMYLHELPTEETLIERKGISERSVHLAHVCKTAKREQVLPKLLVPVVENGGFDNVFGGVIVIGRGIVRIDATVLEAEHERIRVFDTGYIGRGSFLDELFEHLFVDRDCW